MLYAYRDADESPVPVKMTFGAVGPSCFYVEDWMNIGGNPNKPVKFDPNEDYEIRSQMICFGQVNIKSR